MNLPVGILHLILKDHKPTYLTLNKFWYSYFIEKLYEDVKINCERQLFLFLKSLACYPRCREACKNTRVIDMSSFKDIDQVRDHYLFDDLIQVISQFPKLNTLVIHHLSQLSQTDPVICRFGIKLCSCSAFHHIPKRCPSLTSLVYHCVSLNTDVCSKLGGTYGSIYPLMENLVLDMKKVYPYDFTYLINTFRRLTHLTLHIGVVLNQNDQMFIPLMKMGSLLQLQMYFDRRMDESTLLIFWKNATSFPESSPLKVSYAASIFAETPFASKLVIENYPREKERKVTYVSNRNTVDPPFFHHIKKDLHSMEIVSGITVDCNIIRTVEPCLVLYKIISLIDNYDYGHNLSTLCLLNVALCNSDFRNIEKMFPNLQSLNFAMISTECAMISYLPRTKLNKISIFRPLVPMIIIKEKYGHPVCSWHYCEKTQTVVKREDVLSVILDKLPGENVIVLKTSTVEEVTVST
ncbi:hypothetical protein BDB01DRAFT_797475 [Pilobolus umbonatus]|nr:hypothetical protein BDB01DRAFT_797475 [Pilobolus umbonatus]